MNRFLEKSIFWLTIASFMAAVVIRPETYIFPFVFPKVIWFRMVVLVMTGCYAALLASDWERYRPRFNWVSGAVGLFFLSWIISTYVGVDAYRSVWDGHERMLGLFTFVHYVLFFVIISSVIRKREEWRQLCLWFTGTGAVIMLAGVVQTFDPYFLYNNGGARVTGTLGNPIYLGALGFFITIVGLWLAVSAPRKWHWEQWFGGGVAILGITGIFLSDSRGPFLGLVAALGTGILLTIADRQAPRKLRQGLGGLTVAGLLLIGILFAFRGSDFVHGLPVIGRLAGVSIGDTTTNTRIMAWEIAIQGFKEKPMFGWGPNNYMYVFNEHYRPEFLAIGGWAETWFDNAHNILLNTLAVQGAFGLVVYVALFIAAGWVTVTAARAGRVPRTFMVFGLAFLTGHLVQNIFVFENVTSYLYFFFTLAMIVAMTETVPVTNSKAQALPGWALPSIMVAVVLFIYTTDTKAARANHQTWEVLQGILMSTGQRDPKVIDNLLTQYQAMEKTGSPHIDDNRMDVVRTVDSETTKLVSSFGRENTLKLFNLAYEEIKKNRALHPLDVRYHIQQAQLALGGAQITGNVAYIEDAKAAMEDAITKSPNRQQLYYILSVAKLYTRDYEGAKAALQKTIDDAPSVVDGWWRLAGIQLEQGDKEGAKQTFLKAESQGIIFNDSSSAQLRTAAGLPAMTSTTTK